MSEEVVRQKNWIPEIPNEKIRERARHIKPIIRFARGIGGLFRIESSKGIPYYIKEVDLFTTAYTWDPSPRKRVRNLQPVCDVKTYHRWAYYGFFKPSIAEVLAQIPEMYIPEVIAFEIITYPELNDMTDHESEALNAGYHVAHTRLYRKRLFKEVVRDFLL